MVEATLTPVDRGRMRFDVNFAHEHEVVATAVDPEPSTHRIEAPVYNVVIDHPEATILWDTGSHPDAGDGHWPPELYAAFEHVDAAEHPLPGALGDAGYGLADIDAVVQSHLHLDHAGGLHNFAGTDVPVYVHERELKHAYYSAKTDEAGVGYVGADFDHDLNWTVVHRERETHFTDVTFLHLPGHSPGLLGVRVDLDGYGPLVLAGDQFDTRRNYEERQPMGGGLVWSKRHWLESLHWLEELDRRDDATIVCGHDADDVDRLATEAP
jgi:glyoxylase-like metal-dependent hydrolase (beta-lactamase superfamily II)